MLCKDVTGDLSAGCVWGSQTIDNIQVIWEPKSARVCPSPYSKQKCAISFLC